MKILLPTFLTISLLLCAFRVQAEALPEKEPQTVTVIGQVARNGVMKYKDKTTIFSVIFAAGGKTEFGTLRRVKVTRDGKELQFDLTNEKTKNEQFAEPGDVIEVPQKNIFGK
jgi:protein involved in polysaccharide export with SLBB domain